MLLDPSFGRFLSYHCFLLRQVFRELDISFDKSFDVSKFPDFCWFLVVA